MLTTQHTSGNEKAQDEADRDAEAQMKQIKTVGEQGRDKVIADLLRTVLDVRPELPDRIEAGQHRQ
jgi:V-type H+-transporting ATPase subunit G